MAGWLKGRWLDGGWILLCILGSSLWCVTASMRLSATFDEPTYVSLGLESWRTGSSKKLLDLGTMPLPTHVQTLPLYVWERHRGELFDVNRDLDRLLPVARMATLPFWWLLLLYGWLMGRQIAGRWGGRMAIAFLACEPNLLAHASLATTDVAVSACLLAFFYHFRAGRGDTWPRRIAAPAFWFALAVLSKASGLVFGALGVVVIELAHQLPSREAFAGWRNRVRAVWNICRARSFLRDVAWIATLGLMAVFGYCGSDWRTSPSFVSWAHQLPEGVARSSMSWFAEHLRIFSNAGVALMRQVRHNIQGHGVFLLDQVQRRAIWYYFPLAVSIKSPLPLLLLPLLLAAVCRESLRNWACLTAFALLLFSLVCRVQTGIRLILPCLCLAAIGLAAALTIARQRLAAGGMRRLVAVAAAGSGVWLLAAAVSVWPHGLCYTNELWGGTANGYRCLSDSNYDWGQGLKELAQWQSDHHVRDLHVLYYGTDPSLRCLPMNSLQVGSLFLGRDHLPPVMRGRTLAVGTSILYGSLRYHNQKLHALARSLRRLTPIDRTTTFLIYRLPSSEEMAKANKVADLSEIASP